MFQAYLITCVISGKRYIGITSRALRRRWAEHRHDARQRPKANLLFKAIAKHGADSFTMEPLCCARSWADICAVEAALIAQCGTLAPAGYNLTLGGEGRFGFRPSKESVERSAAKHRGLPCHENTRAAAKATHLGKPKSAEHRAKIAAARTGTTRSYETKAKIAAYWAKRRAVGAFSTTKPYAHRKAASAAIAKIPFVLAQYIARVFLP